MKGNEKMDRSKWKWGYKFRFINGNSFMDTIIHADSVSEAMDIFKRDWPGCRMYSPVTIEWVYCG